MGIQPYTTNPKCPRFIIKSAANLFEEIFIKNNVIFKEADRMCISVFCSNAF
jgi:hypothetical protein